MMGVRGYACSTAEHPQSPCGSEPARESGGSVGGDVGCADAFAGKPAPTLVLGWMEDPGPLPFSCGSELARDSGESVGGDVGCADAFASKLAPTGFCVVSRCGEHPQSHVGASLLAIAEVQFAVMLDVPTPSRASSLPQAFVLFPGAVNTHKPMWERACSR